MTDMRSNNENVVRLNRALEIYAVGSKKQRTKAHKYLSSFIRKEHTVLEISEPKRLATSFAKAFRVVQSSHHSMFKEIIDAMLVIIPTNVIDYINLHESILEFIRHRELWISVRTTVERIVHYFSDSRKHAASTEEKRDMWVAVEFFITAARDAARTGDDEVLKILSEELIKASLFRLFLTKSSPYRFATSAAICATELLSDIMTGSEMSRCFIMDQIEMIHVLRGIAQASPVAGDASLMTASTSALLAAASSDSKEHQCFYENLFEVNQEQTRYDEGTLAHDIRQKIADKFVVAAAERDSNNVNDLSFTLADTVNNIIPVEQRTVFRFECSSVRFLVNTEEIGNNSCMDGENMINNISNFNTKFSKGVITVNSGYVGSKAFLMLSEFEDDQSLEIYADEIHSCTVRTGFDTADGCVDVFIFQLKDSTELDFNSMLATEEKNGNECGDALRVLEALIFNNQTLDLFAAMQFFNDTFQLQKTSIATLAVPQKKVNADSFDDSFENVERDYVKVISPRKKVNTDSSNDSFENVEQDHLKVISPQKKVNVDSFENVEQNYVKVSIMNSTERKIPKDEKIHKATNGVSNITRESVEDTDSFDDSFEKVEQKNNVKVSIMNSTERKIPNVAPESVFIEKDEKIHKATNGVSNITHESVEDSYLNFEYPDSVSHRSEQTVSVSPRSSGRNKKLRSSSKGVPSNPKSLAKPKAEYRPKSEPRNNEALLGNIKDNYKEAIGKGTEVNSSSINSTEDLLPRKNCLIADVTTDNTLMSEKESQQPPTHTLLKDSQAPSECSDECITTLLRDVKKHDSGVRQQLGGFVQHNLSLFKSTADAALRLGTRKRKKRTMELKCKLDELTAGHNRLHGKRAKLCRENTELHKKIAELEKQRAKLDKEDELLNNQLSDVSIAYFQLFEEDEADYISSIDSANETLSKQIIEAERKYAKAQREQRLKQMQRVFTAGSI